MEFLFEGEEPIAGSRAEDGEHLVGQNRCALRMIDSHQRRAVKVGAFLQRLEDPQFIRSLSLIVFPGLEPRDPQQLGRIRGAVAPGSLEVAEPSYTEEICHELEGFTIPAEEHRAGGRLALLLLDLVNPAGDQPQLALEDPIRP